MKNIKMYLSFILINFLVMENFAADLKFKSIKPITKKTNFAMTSMSYEVIVENVGTACGTFRIYGYISKTNSISGGLPVYNKAINSMPQNSNYTDVIILDIPCNQRAGDYFLLIKIDAENQIAETDETNNLYSQSFKLMPSLKVNQLIYNINGESQYLDLNVSADSIVTMTKSVSWIEFPNGQNSQTFSSCPAFIMNVNTYIGVRSAEIIVKRGNLTKKIIVNQNGTLSSCFASVNDLSYSSTSHSITVNFSNVNQTMRIEYKPYWSSEWKSVNVNSSPYVIPNLAQGTKYVFRISARCQNSLNFGNSKYFSVSTKVNYSQNKAYIYPEPHVSLTRDINTWYLGTSNTPDYPKTVVSPDVFLSYKVVNYPGSIEIITIQGEVYDAEMSIYEQTGSGLTLVKTIDDNIFGSKMPSVKLAAPEYKPNVTYVVRIYSKGQPGGFQIKQTAVSPLQNNASTRSEIMDVATQKEIDIDYCSNPVENILKLSVTANLDDQVSLQIIDLNGSIVKQNILDVTNGANRFSIDCNDLPSGMYIVRIGDKTKKFVKS